MLVSRNPFARHELHRRNVYSTATCAWCGQSRTTKPRNGTLGKSYLYQFRCETDDGRTYEGSKLFCSKSCHDDYHGN